MRRQRRGTRIGVTYVVPDLAVGGAERHVTTLLPLLDPARFEPSVVCLGDEGALFPDLVDAGVPAVAWRRAKWQAPLALLQLVRELRRRAPDVVITRGYSAETIGRAAAVLAGVPRSVVWVHNCGDTAPRGRLRSLVDTALDRWTDAYFGVADGQVDYMAEDLGVPRAKIRIIKNGVDPGAFTSSAGPALRAELGFGADDLIVGIVAALRPEKDHEGFLVGARRVRDEVPTARFLIVGDGDRRGALEELARQLGLGADVVFAGARADVPAVLDALDVFALCSYSVECFPMALLEAMAAGKPAVCAAVGGVGEMVVDGATGYLVPPRDPAQLAARLVELLRARETRLKFGRAARARVVSEFTLDRCVRQAESELAALARPPVKLDIVVDEVSVGGAEKVMLDVLRFLDPQAVAPRLLCLRAAGAMAPDFRALGVEVEVLDRRGWWDARTVARLVRTMRRRGTDAVLVMHHHRAALALGRVAARLARVPVNIVAPHDMDLTRIGKRCLPRWAVNSLALSDAMVLLSARQGEYLRDEEGVGRRRWSSVRQVVVPNGIEIPRRATAADRAAARAGLALGSDEFVVGIVARLSAQKAHHVLFEAFASLRGVVASARLVVVGVGDREDELRSLARKLGIADRTLFTGARRDVPALLPAFDVACLSSVHEGVPITVIEAMAAGLPVVATDCGSLRDLVTQGETGFLVPVGDSAALAERLEQLAGDRRLRKRMGDNGRTVAERDLRIEDTARGYQDLLTELVRAR